MRSAASASSPLPLCDGTPITSLTADARVWRIQPSFPSCPQKTPRFPGIPYIFLYGPGRGGRAHSKDEL